MRKPLRNMDHLLRCKCGWHRLLHRALLEHPQRILSRVTWQQHDVKNAKFRFRSRLRSLGYKKSQTVREFLSV